MRVLVAPDKFKGSLDALHAARAIARGVSRAFPAAEIDLCPLSDGGEGFDAVLGEALGGVVHTKAVTGLHGASVEGRFRLLADGTALIESAQVIGLALLSPNARDAVEERRTDGLGELVLAALDAGATRIAIGLGGTATMDAGAGLSRALGVDAPRVARTPILVLTDVDNPLLGERGAPRTYGPQKGASAEDIVRIEAAFRRFTAQAGDPGDHPGDGAAGGLGYAFRVFAGAERRPGIDYVMDAVGFEARLDGVDLVLTGEGKLDAQTARGKVVSGVVAKSAARGIPVVALAGSAEDTTSLVERGLTAAFSLVGSGASIEEAMTRAEPLLEALSERALREHVSEGRIRSVRMA
jgi:glycerate kinase